jgi:hypothetical protein
MPGMTKSRSSARRAARVSSGRVVRYSITSICANRHEPVGDGVGVELFAQFGGGFYRNHDPAGLHHRPVIAMLLSEASWWPTHRDLYS